MVNRKAIMRARMVQMFSAVAKDAQTLRAEANELDNQLVERIENLVFKNKSLARICFLVLNLEGRVLFLPEEVKEKIKNSSSKLNIPHQVVQEYLPISTSRAKIYAEAFDIYQECERLALLRKMVLDKMLEEEQNTGTEKANDDEQRE